MAHFREDAPDIARQAREAIDPRLTPSYVQLVRFMMFSPESAGFLRGTNQPSVGSVDYINRQAINFAASRHPRIPLPPETTPDILVSYVLEHYFRVPTEKLDEARSLHSLSMAAENIIGDLLERYIASVHEKHGWVWCSGNVVRAADFIKEPAKGNGWIVLQVKNRDNSENSSSSAIRRGTTIRKWFRTFSKRDMTNWLEFPEPGVRDKLSEEGFKEFSASYLNQLRDSIDPRA